MYSRVQPHTLPRGEVRLVIFLVVLSQLVRKTRLAIKSLLYDQSMTKLHLANSNIIPCMLRPSGSINAIDP